MAAGRTPPDRTWSIGELAELAGVTVKTVRFYSDRGLLPEGPRSSGGHRRYGPAALERLRTVRSLRALGLPLPDVRRVLDGDGTLEDVVAGQLRDVGSQLTALRWREAALQLLADCGPRERAERLRLVGSLATPPGTAALARFWRYWLPPRMPARVVSRVLELTVPQPPSDPTPAQVLAFARLHALVSGACDGGERPTPAAHRPDGGHRPAVLYEGLDEAYALAAPHLRAGRAPREGDALDCFVAAYARSRRLPDTPAFRDELSRVLAADPRIDRYWQLVAELSGPAHTTPGAAHDWLCAALAASAAHPAS
ncbi:MerR family transcriptional regulator [Streptomyces sp. V4-01]|uniref:MerR family transcriptional regulator n=1 Tax=Actinacidiphila polyblastidii TaxID=3110430 RepID=A0ABU7PD33_9ACTN|nr:MerR family transcriptional regulator [Streptomyces sp. V4-01]